MTGGRPWRWLVVGAAVGTAGVMGATAAGAQSAAPATGYGHSAKALACVSGKLMCTEVDDYDSAFGGKYVGHDEPSTLYYSNAAGAGNHNTWQLTIPKDPPPATVPGRSSNFQLTPSFWFRLAM